MKLVIVESPTKAKTIEGFLGKDYKVVSSYGHVRDLPKSKIGIDTEEGTFEPTYVIPTKVRKRVNELKRESQKADEVILASDEDREGEAIAWHLTKALELPSESTKRIVFHEITEEAIQEALQHPRNIDLKLVDAQQSRRILDRLVGYELSPFLWKKLFRGLSAGRVQSVAVRLIVEREREIEKFKPQEYWSLIANLLPSSGKEEFEAKLVKKDEELLDKFSIENEKNAESIVKELDNADYIVKNIKKKEIKRNPNAPFTTSTLQQEASSKLYFSAKQTMMAAQKLYEKGHITYMRTDSVNLSTSSLKSAKEVIEKNYGKEFVLKEPRKFKNKSKRAQEAHEAVRPTHPEKTPENLQDKLDEKQFKLYNLIWRRFIASQMESSVSDSTTVEIEAGKYGFRTSGSIMKFEGWLKAYDFGKGITGNVLPNLKENEQLKLVKLAPNQHFTEPPPRYNEASLVKILEEYGIGRPSTYAPTIATILGRNYVDKNDQKRFIPTETGIMVDDILTQHFPKIVDMDFTVKMEEDLDKIAEGKIEWVPIIKEFYVPFHENLQKKYDEVEKQKTDEETNEKCDKCDKPMVIKYGRFGRFMACSGFPDCKNTKTIKKDKAIGMQCPDCKDGEIIIKRTKTRRTFYGCSEYPECEYASWKNPAEEKSD